MTTTLAREAVRELAERLDRIVRPGGCRVVRVGVWAWYRDERGELQELALPDVNLGDVDPDELVRMLPAQSF